MSPILVLGVALLFVSLFLVLAVVGGLTRERSGVTRSLQVVEALTAAPKELTQDLDPSFQERVLFPVLARAQGFGRKITPADAAARLREKLEKAGNPQGWTVERLIAGKAVGFVVAVIGGLTTLLVMGASFPVTLGTTVVAALLGYNVPDLYLYQKAYDRRAAISKALPDAIDLLTISVESGLGFDAALAQVARNTDGPLSDEFARMLQEMQIGRSRADALRSLAERCDPPEVRSFAGAMVQADAFGIPVGQVLRVQSSEIRVKRRQWAEEKAQQVPVKIMPPLIFCILPCLFIVVLGPAALSVMASFSGG